MHRSVLRATQERTGQGTHSNTIPTHAMVAARIARQYGQDLYRFCHMGKETSVYSHALYTCLTVFVPDFRGLLDNAPVFHTAKHIRKLGLEALVPGLLTQDQDRADNFMKVLIIAAAISISSLPIILHLKKQAFVWRSSMGPVLSEGIGINAWSLLVMASLIGSSNLHPKCASDFARSILTRILRHAPRAATPGNKLPIRSFNTQSGKAEMLIISSESRPDHFVRPNMDDVFATTGEFTYCRGKGQFLPEDVLHCPHLMALAGRLVCSPHEVPARHLQGYYQLIPNQAYPVYRAADSDARHPTPTEGSIRVGGGKVTIRLDNDGNGAPFVEHCDFFSWEQRLADLGLVVLPLVARLGAAVWTSSARSALACLVPSGRDGDEECNFDAERVQYLALHAEGVPPTPIGIVETLELLVPIGTPVCIVPDSAAWVALQPKFPPGIAPDRLAQTGVRARLTVPPSARGHAAKKLYLTVPQRARFLGEAAPPPITIEVDPWEVVPSGGGAFDEIRELVA